MHEILNQLLYSSKSERISLLKQLNLAAKKKLFDAIPTLTATLGLTDVTQYEKRVEMRFHHISQYPNEIHWDHPEYINGNECQCFPNSLVSTKGDVIRYNEKGKFTIRLAVEEEEKAGYQCFNTYDGNRPLHRILGMTFLPRKEFSNIPFCELDVKHIDRIRDNNRIGNLRWGRRSEAYQLEAEKENNLHYRFFLFEVTVDNGYCGESFILREDEIEQLKATKSALRQRVKSRVNFNGLRVTIVKEKSDCPTSPERQKEILDLYLKDKRYFNPRLKPILGRIEKGRMKGLLFSWFGEMDYGRYFYPTTVTAVIAGGQKLRGITLKRVTHREAIPHHNQLTHDILITLRESN